MSSVSDDITMGSLTVSSTIMGKKVSHFNLLEILHGLAVLHQSHFSSVRKSVIVSKDLIYFFSEPRSISPGLAAFPSVTVEEDPRCTSDVNHQFRKLVCVICIMRNLFPDGVQIHSCLHLGLPALLRLENVVK